MLMMRVTQPGVEVVEVVAKCLCNNQKQLQPRIVSTTHMFHLSAVPSYVHGHSHMHTHSAKVCAHTPTFTGTRTRSGVVHSARFCASPCCSHPSGISLAAGWLSSDQPVSLSTSSRAYGPEQFTGQPFTPLLYLLACLHTSLNLIEPPPTYTTILKLFHIQQGSNHYWGHPTQDQPCYIPEYN